MTGTRIELRSAGSARYGVVMCYLGSLTPESGPRWTRRIHLRGRSRVQPESGKVLIFQTCGQPVGGDWTDLLTLRRFSGKGKAHRTNVLWSQVCLGL